MTIDELQNKFGIKDALSFEAGQGGLARIAVKTPDCQGHIYLHGAHVTHYQRTGEKPVLFLSEKSNFQPGKPIRGGIPICFPWFSNRGPTPESPMHGFARVMDWEVMSTEKTGSDVQVVLQLQSNDETRKLWPEDFQASFRVTFGKQFTMNLEVKNISSRPFKFEEALHTYLAVSDIRQVSLRGLGGVSFTTKVAGQQGGIQDRAAPITFSAETDRVYAKTSSNCTVEDLPWKREIIVAKSNSMTTVVWNPWIDRAKALADFGDEEWQQMLCVESANAFESAITLKSGQSHTMGTILARREIL